MPLSSTAGRSNSCANIELYSTEIEEYTTQSYCRTFEQLCVYKPLVHRNRSTYHSVLLPDVRTVVRIYKTGHFNLHSTEILRRSP